MRYMRNVPRRFKSGFREGKVFFLNTGYSFVTYHSKLANIYFNFYSYRHSSNTKEQRSCCKLLRNEVQFWLFSCWYYYYVWIKENQFVDFCLFTVAFDSIFVIFRALECLMLYSYLLSHSLFVLCSFLFSLSFLLSAFKVRQGLYVAELF